MMLESIYLSKETYGPNKGRYGGKVKFTGDLGEVQVNLSEELSKGILQVCAKEIVTASREVAEKLTEQSLNLPMIEGATETSND